MGKIAMVMMLAWLTTPERCEREPGHGHGGDGGVAPLVCSGPPGLYEEGSCHRLAPGVLPYEPEHALWSDGAEKERFIYLPPGTQIDTANPDRWTFPQGTRLYKTFSHDGVRLETRILEKTGSAPGPASWTMVAYAWSEDQLSVSLVPAAGAQNVLGTNHDIPSQAQCGTCHTAFGSTLDISNGFQAIQLNHGGRGVTLARLIAEGRLTNSAGTEPNVSVRNSRIPGSRRERAALGYLHANCGNCHGGPNPRAGLALWSTVGDCLHVEDTPAYQNTVCQALTRWTGRVNADGDPIAMRVEPGHPELSGIVARMSARGSRDQMPPLGTEVVDAEGLEAISDWIVDLDASCEAPAP
ncbi:MAG: hypothetical protein K8H88_02485 [Sandaracinaceae bacterium]|nr:hypothetical protein [Sandaracinaceae bacterium]